MPSEVGGVGLASVLQQPLMRTVPPAGEDSVGPWWYASQADVLRTALREMACRTGG